MPARSKRLADTKRKAVLERINRLQDAMGKAQEYLESGRHAHWHGFRPLFHPKVREGANLPPHKDWVKHVFLPRCERALRQADKALEKLSS